MKTKIRIDQYLVDFGFFSGIEVARGNLMAHKVIVNDELVTKPGLLVKLDGNLDVRIKGVKSKYVSRAGYKLEEIVSKYSVSFEDKVVLDVGSSTGGFTDFVLQNGAELVYALDVGTNQLDYRLRSHSQVISIEKTNFRTIASDFFTTKFDVILMDVSFISVRLLLENVVNNLRDDGIFICLIKPQFEASRSDVDALNAIIDDVDVVRDIILNIVSSAKDCGLEVYGLSKASIKGTYGNQEYVALMRHSLNSNIDLEIDSVIEELR